MDENFFEKLRTMFHDREVELVVHDMDNEDNYPFDNPVQVKFLEEALASVRKGEYLVSFGTIEELRRYTT